MPARSAMSESVSTWSTCESPAAIAARHSRHRASAMIHDVICGTLFCVSARPVSPHTWEPTCIILRGSESPSDSRLSPVYPGSQLSA